MHNLATLLFSLSILCYCISCNGNIKSAQQQANLESEEVGREVYEIDYQIWDIFQDAKGDFWFGSNGRGIYHYNGSQLKVFTTKDGLVDNDIRGIQQDHNHNIYIETPDGISRYKEDVFTTLEPIRSPSNEWKLDSTDLWFGYNAYDLYRFDGHSLFELQLPKQDLKEAFGMVPSGVPFSGLNNTAYAVFGVDQDKEGNIWFGTATAGAFRYDGESFIWFGEPELSTLPDGRVPGVRSMIQDKDGYYWLSNFYSKYKLDPMIPKGYEKVKAVDIADNLKEDKLLYFNSGLVDREGNLWMTTYHGGVWKYDGKQLSNYEIKNDYETVLLVCIYEDNDGVIWLGTNNDGVYKQNEDGFEKFILKSK